MFCVLLLTVLFGVDVFDVELLPFHSNSFLCLSSVARYHYENIEKLLLRVCL